MMRPSMIRIATRPFITRALRGRRGRRLVALGLMLTALSGVLGTWLALGTGDFEREVRVALQMEEGRWLRERREFVIVADDVEEASALRRVLARFAETRPRVEIGTDAEYRALDVVRNGATTIRDAGFSLASPRDLREVQWKARRAFDDYGAAIVPELGYPTTATSFSWYDRDAVEGLRAVLDRRGVPAVELYASPLSLIDALRLSGLVAGAALMLLLMLAAPVLAGTQMAQETHENTLQPLVGSALRAEELALGLTSGPLATVALLAGPQMALMLVAALFTGSPGAGLALVGVTLAGGAFLVVLAQLAGLALGRLRSPGLVGGALAVVLGILGGVGLALAAEVTPRTLGALAVLPQAAGGHALAQAFGFGHSAVAFGGPHDTTWPVLIGGLGMLTFAGLGMSALARRIGQTAPSALRAGEALAGAVVAMVLVTFANPMRSHGHPEESYLLNLGVLSLPLAVLLMMRAPIGDAPAALGRTSTRRLVLELLGWAALYLGFAAASVGIEQVHVLTEPVALAYLLWFLTVGALLSLRLVMAPLKLLSWLWVGFCVMALGTAFWQSAAWAVRSASTWYPEAPLFVFGALSPFLGVVQAIMTIVIPVVLVRSLRRRG